ncbi:hypothetical protein RvY_02205 [Ramazzottius varieornatus]|uniref:Uncharacterized protein n=1 Tax=Ramazzottius varieornatus TaxID=947166 RepID=A0A1D1UJ00_RAMVA|nr:hypothetical protein RvY_02205 [Ramazzottius varieornatus]
MVRFCWNQPNHKLLSFRLYSTTAGKSIPRDDTFSGVSVTLENKQWTVTKEEPVYSD